MVEVPHGVFDLYKALFNTIYSPEWPQIKPLFSKMAVICQDKQQWFTKEKEMLSTHLLELVLMHK